MVFYVNPVALNCSRRSRFVLFVAMCEELGLEHLCSRFLGVRGFSGVLGSFSTRKLRVGSPKRLSRAGLVDIAGKTALLGTVLPFPEVPARMTRRVLFAHFCLVLCVGLAAWAEPSGLCAIPSVGPTLFIRACAVCWSSAAGVCAVLWTVRLYVLLIVVLVVSSVLSSCNWCCIWRRS